MIQTYDKLRHVNYGGATCNITPLTLTADFTEYQSVSDRLHNLVLHDWGVASGLQVQATPGAPNVVIQPGVAIDRKGNLIVLSTGGSGLLGDAAPLTEVPAPVTVPTAGLIAQKYLLTIQWKESHRQIPSPPDFFCGKEEQTPQIRLQTVTGFTDADDYVCLAIIELDAAGGVLSVTARDSAAPLGRRRLGETVGAIRFEASLDGAPTGNVQDTPVATLEPLTTGNGLQIAADLTALTGKLCVAPSSATPPADAPGSLVVLSSTPGGGGGVKTLDGNGKVLAAFTTTGSGGQQAGYVSVGTAAGTEIASLSASATGAGQVQVQTRAGKPAVVLATSGNADDGMVHVLSNNQDVVTLGPAGISAKGNIATQGSVVSQGGLSTPGAVSCSFVRGSDCSLSASSVAGRGWNLAPGGVFGDGWNLSPNGLTTNGWLNTAQVVKAGGQVQCGGALIAAGNVQTGGALIAAGNVQTGGVVIATGNVQTSAAVLANGLIKAGGQLQCGGALIAGGNLQCAGQVIAQGDIFGRTKHFVMSHPNDETKDIVYGSIEGPEAAAYLRGRAALQNGRAQIAFPEHFALVVNPDTLTVQLTPRSAASKGLAVVAAGSAGFSVQELFDGTGSYDFDYFASGVRRGLEGYQPVVAKGGSPLADAVGPAMMSAMTVPTSVAPAEPTTAVDAVGIPETATAFTQPIGPLARPEPWNLR